MGETAGFSGTGEYLMTVSQEFPVLCGNVSAVFMVFWDWLTTLDDEVAFIWTRDSGLSGRPLYFFIRYGGFAFQVYDMITQFGTWRSDAAMDFCHAYFALLPIGTLVFLYAADVLLAYRALCLWRMNRKLLFITCGIFVLSLICSTVVLCFSISGFQRSATPDYLTGCWVIYVPEYNFLAPLPGLLFEFWVFGLVIARVLKYSRQQGAKLSRIGIVGLLFNDSMWWFTAISLMIIVNAVFLSFAGEELSTFFLPYFRSVVIVFGCRLIIRMRKASQIAQSSELQWNMSSDVSRRQKDPRAFQNQEPDAQRMEQALTMAQRIGLPPALQQDLVCMWFEPVTTLNTNSLCGIEMGIVPPSPEDPPEPMQAADDTLVAWRDNHKRRQSIASWEDEDADICGESFHIRCVMGDGSSVISTPTQWPRLEDDV